MRALKISAVVVTLPLALVWAGVGWGLAFVALGTMELSSWLMQAVQWWYVEARKACAL